MSARHEIAGRNGAEYLVELLPQESGS
jgi:hypothetical protein